MSFTLHELYGRLNSFNINEKYLLLLILVIAAILAYYPHVGYDYPLHRDEWIELTRSKAIIEASSTSFVEPYLGERVIENDLEVGIHLWIAELLLVSGVSEWILMKYLPVLITCFLVLSAYLLGNRLGYGIEAAFFVALIPTSVRLLGPAFVAAVSLAVPFIFLSAYIAFNYRTKRELIALIFLLTFLYYIHPPTAIAANVFLLFHMIYHRDKRIVYVILIAFLLALPNIYVLFTPFFEQPTIEGAEAAVSMSPIARFGAPFEELGYIPTIIAIIGIFFTIYFSRKELPLFGTLVFFLLLLVLYQREGTALFMPTRNIFYVMLLLSFFAGYGLSLVRKKLYILAFVIAIVTLIFSVQAHVDKPYYHIISDEEFESFSYIKENVRGEKAVVHPWKGFAFPAVAEKHIYTYFIPGLGTRNNEVHAFFSAKCDDTSFLKENNISIVYYPNCQNEDLKKIRENIYVLKESR